MASIRAPANPSHFFPYQRAGVEYALQRKDTLIADQPGLGKSPMGVGVFNADPKVKRCLVIAPASLKEHWRREFELWKTKDATVGIAETNKEIKEQIGVFKSGKQKGKPRYKTVDTIKEFWPDTDVVIINYDILSRFNDQIKAIAWDLLICDEAHALKTTDSGRTLFILGGKKKDKSTGWKPVWYNAIEANRRVFLTGTPMMNRPSNSGPSSRRSTRTVKRATPIPRTRTTPSSNTAIATATAIGTRRSAATTRTVARRATTTSLARAMGRSWANTCARPS
jgi:SNF2 family DNA or RNA helicase